MVKQDYLNLFSHISVFGYCFEYFNYFRYHSILFYLFLATIGGCFNYLVINLLF